MPEDNKVKIAAMADLHVKIHEKGKWADIFKEISRQAQVLLICGDLTDTGDEAEAEVLAEELKSCKIPVVTVLGNHDCEKGRQKIVRQIIQKEHVFVLDGESVVLEDIGFAGVKGFGGGFDDHMLSMFGEDPMKDFVKAAVNESLALDRALTRLDQDGEVYRKVAVMHYSPIRQTVEGEPPEIFPFMGCSRLAEPLSRRQVVAAFHGHAHRGHMTGEAPGGVKVFNVAIHVLHKSGFQVPFFILEV
jgi:Icc-related predicted phosphoesterase